MKKAFDQNVSRAKPRLKLGGSAIRIVHRYPGRRRGLGLRGRRPGRRPPRVGRGAGHPPHVRCSPPPSGQRRSAEEVSDPEPGRDDAARDRPGVRAGGGGRGAGGASHRGRRCSGPWSRRPRGPPVGPGHQRRAGPRSAECVGQRCPTRRTRPRGLGACLPGSRPARRPLGGPSPCAGARGRGRAAPAPGGTTRRPDRDPRSPGRPRTGGPPRGAAPSTAPGRQRVPAGAPPRAAAHGARASPPRAAAHQRRRGRRAGGGADRPAPDRAERSRSSTTPRSSTTWTWPAAPRSVPPRRPEGGSRRRGGSRPRWRSARACCRSWSASCSRWRASGTRRSSRCRTRAPRPAPSTRRESGSRPSWRRRTPSSPTASPRRSAWPGSWSASGTTRPSCSRSVDALSAERDTLARQVADLTAERAELLEARKALESVHRALTEAARR